MGRYVILRHRGGYETHYYHNQRVLVRRAERVRAGQVIALSGNTGRVVGQTGEHLHFEVRHRGRSIDPLTVLPRLAEK